MAVIKKGIKKATALLLSVLTVFSLVGVAGGSVSAATAYDPSAALAYAKAHWNDGKGECAEFVRDCLRAGGLTSLTSIGCRGLKDQIVNGGWGELKKLTSTNGAFLMSVNRDILSPGDPIIWYCSGCNIYPHMVLCSGQDSSGYVTDYAHNNAHNNKRTYFSLGSSSSHYRHSVSVYSIHMFGSGYYPLSEYVYATFKVINPSGTMQRNAPYNTVDDKDTAVIDALEGTVLTVTGAYVNDNNIKYYKTESGYWVLAADLEKTGDLESLSLSGASVPADMEKGSSFSVKGTVTSASSPISSVTVGVYKADGTAAIEKTVSPEATLYSLSGVDSALKFGEVFTGEYTYRITAKNALSEKVLLEQAYKVYSDDFVTVTFNAGEGVCATETAKAVRGEYLTEIPEATREDYYFDGWFDENGDKLTAETVIEADCTFTAYWTKIGEAIPDDQLKTELDSPAYASVTVTAEDGAMVRSMPYPVYYGEDTAMNIAQAGDQFIIVGMMTNSYREVWYMLDNGAWIYSGDVTEPENIPAVELTGANYPEMLVKGKSFSIKGTAKVKYSELDITSLTVGVYKADGTAATSKTVAPQSESYDIKNIDAYIKFGSLALGSYTYRITAKTVLGEVTLLEKPFSVVNASVTVTLDAGEGECDTSSLTVESGKAVGTLPTATREGYIFSGWLDADGNVVTADTVITAAVTFTAKWTKALTSDDVNSVSPTEEQLAWEIEGYVYAEYEGSEVTLRNVPYVTYLGTVTSAGTLNGKVTVVAYTENYYGEKWFKTADDKWVKETDVAKVGDLVPFSLSEDTNYPDKIRLEYTSCKLVGTITSLNTDMTEVNGGIYDSTGARIYGKTVSVSGKTFSISTIDNAIAFRSIGAGEYTYKVIATNSCGTYTVIDYPFTVVKSLPTYVTVTFNANGGECDTSSLTVESGKAVGTLPAATREGYSFLGWYDAGGSKLTAATVVSADMTATAKWENDGPTGDELAWEIEGYVYAEYEGSGVTLRNVPYVTYLDTDTSAGTLNGKATVVAYTENYYGEKWFKTADGKWVKETDVTKVGDLMPFSLSSNTSYPEKVHLAYTSCSIKGTITSLNTDMTEVNGGIYDSTGNRLYGKTVSVSGTTFDLATIDNSIAFRNIGRGEYTYRVTVTNGCGTYNVIDYSFTVVDEYTVYATVTFDAGEGECDTPSLTVLSGELLPEIPTPTRYGYDFVGWYDHEGNKLTSSTVINEDITFAARWKENTPSADKLAWEIKGYVYEKYVGVGAALRNVPYENYLDHTTLVAYLTDEVTVVAYTVNYYGEKWLQTADGDWVKETDVTKVGEMVPFSLSEDTNYPEEYHLSYTSCKLVGTITSLNTNITEVSGGIYDLDGNRLYGRTVSVGAMTFNISKIDDYIAFRKIGAGEYIYRVTVVNSVGTFDVIDYAFTVVDELPTFVTVTFDANGGECDIDEVEIESGTPITVLPEATRGGYVFDGWYDADGNKLSEESVITADMTVTAKWSRMVGDVSGDGKIDATDLITVQQCILGLGEYNADYDVNGDGAVDAADAVIIQLKILGIG